MSASQSPSRSSSPSRKSLRNVGASSQQLPAPVPPAPAAKPLSRIHSDQGYKKGRLGKKGLLRRISTSLPPSPIILSHSTKKGTFSPPSSQSSSPALSSPSSPTSSPSSSETTKFSPVIPAELHRSSPLVATSSKLWPQLDSVVMSPSSSQRTLRTHHLRQSPEEIWDQMRSRGLVLKGNVFDSPPATEDPENSPFMLSPSHFGSTMQFPAPRQDGDISPRTTRPPSLKQPSTKEETENVASSSQTINEATSVLSRHRASVSSDCTFPQSCYAESVLEANNADADNDEDEDSPDGSIIRFRSASVATRPYSVYTTATHGGSTFMLADTQSPDEAQTAASWYAAITSGSPLPNVHYDSNQNEIPSNLGINRNNSRTSIDSQVAYARRQLRTSSIATDMPAFASPNASTSSDAFDSSDASIREAHPEHIERLHSDARLMILPGSDALLSFPRAREAMPPTWTKGLHRVSSYVPALDLIIDSYAESINQDVSPRVSCSDDEDRNASSQAPSLSRSSTVVSLASIQAPTTPLFTAPLSHPSNGSLKNDKTSASVSGSVVRQSRIPQPTLMFSMRSYSSSRKSTSSTESSSSAVDNSTPLGSAQGFQSMIFNIEKALAEVEKPEEASAKDPNSRFSANSSLASNATRETFDLDLEYGTDRDTYASTEMTVPSETSERERHTSLLPPVSFPSENASAIARSASKLPKPVMAPPAPKTRVPLVEQKAPSRSSSIASWFGFRSQKSLSTHSNSNSKRR